MEGTYEYMWIIIGSILLVALIKVIYQIYKNKVGERCTYRPIQTSTANSNSQISTSIREFGTVNYYANARYNQKDRWFQFMYREVNGEWLAYILRMPSLNGRDGDLHLTHRYKKENIFATLCIFSIKLLSIIPRVNQNHTKFFFSMRSS